MKHTEKEYVDMGGKVCPNCGSDNLQGLGLDLNGATVYGSVICDDCQTTWTDVYDITAIKDIDVPKDE